MRVNLPLKIIGLGRDLSSRDLSLPNFFSFLSAA
jgi:hypothetical protein